MSCNIEHQSDSPKTTIWTNNKKINWKKNSFGDNPLNHGSITLTQMFKLFASWLLLSFLGSNSRMSRTREAMIKNDIFLCLLFVSWSLILCESSWHVLYKVSLMIFWIHIGKWLTLVYLCKKCSCHLGPIIPICLC